MKVPLMPSVSRSRSPFGGIAIAFAVLSAVLWSDGVSAQTNRTLPDYVVKEFGVPPAIPDGPLAPALQRALANCLLQSNWGSDQAAAFSRTVASNDPRIAWLVSDMMRLPAASA